MLDAHMKNKIVIGPFHGGGLTDGNDGGGLTDSNMSGLADGIQCLTDGRGTLTDIV